MSINKELGEHFPTVLIGIVEQYDDMPERIEIAHKKYIAKITKYTLKIRPYFWITVFLIYCLCIHLIVKYFTH